MTRFAKALCALSASTALATGALAGVTASVNTDATVWPGTPAIITYATPNFPVTASSIARENFGGNGIATTGRGVSQVFTPTSTFPLGSIKILSAGSGGGDPHTMHIFDVTGITGNQSSYAPAALNGGTDLIGGLSFVPPSSGANDALMSFDFDGASQITLTADRRYAFEIWGPTSATGGGPFLWGRGGGGISTYLGGDGYEGQVTRDDNMNGVFAPADLAEVRTQLAGGSRDMVLGVYAVPEPAAIGAIAIAAAAGLIARRRRP